MRETGLFPCPPLIGTFPSHQVNRADEEEMGCPQNQLEAYLLSPACQFTTMVMDAAGVSGAGNVARNLLPSEVTS